MCTQKTHIRSHLCEHQVDAPAHDVVAPGLVVRAVVLLRQRGDALLGAVPLLVGAPANLLGGAADLLDAPRAELGVGDVGGRGGLDPAVEVRNPGVVFEHRALLVEAPKGHLLQRRQGFAVVLAARVHDAAVQVDDRGGDVLALRAELGDLVARDGRLDGVARWQRGEGKEVLDRVVKSREIADGVDAPHDVLVKETIGDGIAAGLEDGHLVGVDGQVVDGRDGLEVALGVVILGALALEVGQP